MPSFVENNANISTKICTPRNKEMNVTHAQFGCIVYKVVYILMNDGRAETSVFLLLYVLGYLWALFNKH